jgi:hypothetical protein
MALSWKMWRASLFFVAGLQVWEVVDRERNACHLVEATVVAIQENHDAYLDQSALLRRQVEVADQSDGKEVVALSFLENWVGRET